MVADTIPVTERVNAGPDDIGWLQYKPDGNVNVYVIRPGRPTFILMNLQVKPCPFSSPTATPSPRLGGSPT